MEPSRKSVLTAARTMGLAEELGIPRLAGVGNKASSPEGSAFFAEVCAEYGVPLAAVVPYDDEIASADRLGTRVQPPSGAVRDAVEAIVDFVESLEAQRAALLVERERIDRRLAELSASTAASPS